MFYYFICMHVFQFLSIIIIIIKNQWQWLLLLKISYCFYWINKIASLLLIYLMLLSLSLSRYSNNFSKYNIQNESRLAKGLSSWICSFVASSTDNVRALQFYASCPNTFLTERRILFIKFNLSLFQFLYIWQSIILLTLSSIFEIYCKL